MSGMERMKCPKCGKWYRFNYQLEKFYPNCDCKQYEDE